MATENRKIQLQTTVDTTGAKQGFQEVKDAAKDMAQGVGAAGKEAGKGMEGLGAGADAAAKKVEQATNNIRAAIERATARVQAQGQGPAAQFTALANMRGANVDALKPYLAQLDEAIAKSKAANDAMTGSTASLDKVGISAKQTTAALRGIPAQFTDIATSLAGGQNPLTVLLQQGGQLKDMFGGIGPAASALGGYVVGLVTPLTLAAAAAGILTAAFIQGSKEVSEYQKSLILTGNYVGQTTSSMQALAKAIGTNGITQGAAADALAQVAATGKIAGSSLQLLAQAAVEMERTTGTAVSKTVAQFVDLSEEPTKASLRLNEALHYLDLATYSRIQTLEEQGRKEEAAAVAEQTYAKAVGDRTREVRENLGTLPAIMKGVGEAAKTMWDSLMNVGRERQLSDQIADAASRLKGVQQAQQNPGPYRGGGSATQLKQAEAELAFLKTAQAGMDDTQANAADRTKFAQAQVDAQARVDALRKSVQSEADIRKKEIDQLKRDASTLNMAQSDYDKLVADINAKHKDPAAKAVTDDAGTKMLQNLRDQGSALQAQLDSSEKLTASERELAKFEQQIADLKEKKILTSDQKSLLAKQAEIEAQLQQNVALDKQVVAQAKARQEQEKAVEAGKQFAKQIEDINLAITSSATLRNQQNADNLAAYGLGDNARVQLQAMQQIQREYARYQLQLDKANEAAKAAGLLGSPGYDDEVKKIQSSLALSLASQSKYYDDLKVKQTDWRNGASEALNNFLDTAANVSAQTKTLFSQAFDGITDVFTNFITTGKGGFQDFAKSVVASLVKIQVQAILTANGTGGILGSLGGFLGLAIKGAAGGGASTAIGGINGSAGGISIGNMAALGAVFDRAGLLQSANGNIFDRATLHGYGDGKMGVIGEAGPEGVFPLKRGRDGKLGIAAAGGGGGDTYNLYFTVGDVATMSDVRSTVSQAMVASQAARARTRVYGDQDAA